MQKRIINFDPKQRKAIAIQAALVCGSNIANAFLAVDTGAYEVILNRKIAETLLGQDLSKAKTQQITDFGQTQTTSIITLDVINIIGLERKNFPILCKEIPHNLSVDGILGRRFFENLKLTFDFKLGQIVIEF